VLLGLKSGRAIVKKKKKKTFVVHRVTAST
jgi:hypothetical protein